MNDWNLGSDRRDEPVYPDDDHADVFANRPPAASP